MIIYNNENNTNTVLLKKQPKVYKDEKELIDWLNYDINIQKSCKEPYYISLTHQLDETTANIGNDSNIIEINFEFDFQVIKDKVYGIENYKLNFKNIIFNKKVFFENIHLHNEVFFNNTEFKSEINFSNIAYNENLYFNNSIFHNELSFINSKFYGNVYLNETIINGNINIKNSLIASNMFLNNIKINNNIIFKEIIFKDNNSYLSIKNENSKKNKINNFYFTNVLIDSVIDLQNIEVEEADFKGSVINGGLINPVNFKVHKFANRESALFLKNEAYARNNAIDALKYKAKEIECHKDDLMKSAKDIIQNKEYSFTKKIKELYKIVGDIASIYLSSLYSDNGQNWIKALFMTILITALCFTVFYIPDLTDSNIIRLYYRNLFPELIKYFIPTDYSLIIKYAASKLNLFLKTFGVLVYFLEKILFWYGSVQTVQAFRKFAKGA
ncbi:hypothetical protein [Brachyspira intermedia]|uniref:hypothetical protein n=1 Tax=Brachyspira intermedia TaxID=84377 RepID=UPI003004AF9E